MTLSQTSSSEDGDNIDLEYFDLNGGIACSPARVLTAGAVKPNFKDNSGLVLKNVHVQLVFWGSAWETGEISPTRDEVTTAVKSILAGPYMSMLDQYRHIGNGELNGTTSVITPVADSPANPPHPFSEGDVWTLVSNLINSRKLTDPASDDQLLYCVVMPPGVNYDKRHIIGLHSFQELGGVNVHYAWIMNGGTLASVTRIFSHELVESCTDPEGSAILDSTGTCKGDSWCEIADVCEHQPDEVVDGITLQSYWSQHEGMCVIPK